MDDHGGSVASDLSLEDLMDEYSSQPPQIAEWLWCIEFVAKFVKNIRCILDLMNMGYQYSNDYGKRINEVLSLRILEFIFDPTKNDSAMGIGGASSSEARVEFDLSLSNTDVLRAILKEIPVSELRAGMPELSKFNVLPFIAHKNMCLPLCALEKLRDGSLMENQRSAASSMEANAPILSDDISAAFMDTCEEEPVDEQQQNMNMNEKDEVIVMDDEDDPMHTNEKDEVVVMSEDCTTGEPINNGNGNTTDASVKCTKDGTWLISRSDDDDESDMVKGPALAKRNTNTYTNLLHSCSQTRPENVCWKCEKEGTLLICSKSECGAKVHKECLNRPVNVDEEGNFYCPVCWYDRIAAEYY